MSDTPRKVLGSPRKNTSKTFSSVTPASARKELAKYDGNMEHMLRTQLQLLEHMQTSLSVEMMTGGNNIALLQESLDKAKVVSAMMENVSATLVRWRAAQKKIGDTMSPEQVLEAAENLIKGLPRVDRRKCINRLIDWHNKHRQGPFSMGGNLLPEDEGVEVSEVHAVSAAESLQAFLGQSGPDDDPV